MTAFCLLPLESTTQEKPNILWIMADDMGTDLGCYGNKSVKTPNLDKLSSEGITFTSAFTVTPVSSPSRSSLITAMYPVSIGCHQHRTRNKNPLPGDVLPITEYFRQAGYYVCNGEGTGSKRPGKTDYNFTFADRPVFDGPDWSARKPGQPFYAQLQIQYPHRPFKKDTLHPVDRSTVFIPPVYPDHPVAREDWALYLESVQLVDKYVGQIMQRLEKEGLLNNTIVMFFSDQGRPMVRAKQFLYDDGTQIPLIVRFPDNKSAGIKKEGLVSVVDIPATSLKLAGIRLPETMQGQDIFSGKEREFVYSTRDRMDETVDRIRSIRSKKFKYIVNFYPDRPYTQFNTYKKTMYPVLTLMKVLYSQGRLTTEQRFFMASERPAEEFYDLVNDPFEMKNEANNPIFTVEKERMRKELDKWLAANDKGVYPEDQAEVGFWKNDAEQAYQKKMKSYGLPADISDEDYLKWWERQLKLN